MHRAGKDCFHYHNEHCAVFENDLRYICPTNDKDRKKKLTEFAAQYGFRLRLYRPGLFAIFGKQTSPVAIHAGAFPPRRQLPVSFAPIAQGSIGRFPTIPRSGRDEHAEAQPFVLMPGSLIGP